MSVPVAEEWLWRRGTFVNPLPLAEVWSEKSKVAGDRAFAQGMTPAAFSCAFQRGESANLPQYFVWSILALRVR